MWDQVYITETQVSVFRSSIITEWGVIGKWGCRCSSKCSVGTAVGIKISIWWWPEKINFMSKKSYFGMFCYISRVSKLSYLVPLALRNVWSGRYGTTSTCFVLSCFKLRLLLPSRSKSFTFVKTCRKKARKIVIINDQKLSAFLKLKL